MPFRIEPYANIMFVLKFIKYSNNKVNIQNVIFIYIKLSILVGRLFFCFFVLIGALTKWWI